MNSKLVLFVALLALASCGTIEGFGSDISAGARMVGSWF